MSSSQPPLVLVTGVSGYVGGVVAKYALACGYRVRGTVRSLKDETKVNCLRKFAGPAGALELVEATLEQADCWPAAVAGATYVLHVASPVPRGSVKDEERDIVQPAVAGVTNVLRAAAAPGSTVQRMVLTSSIAAVFEGRTAEWASKTFTEADFSHAPACGGYARSKVRAEQAGWELLKEVNAARAATGATPFELAVINPGFVIGPIATDGAGSSTEVYFRLLDGAMPAIPALSFPSIDVRDVAIAHLKAMLLPGAAGKRFILTNGCYPMRQMAADLAAEFARHGYKIPTGKLPSWLVRLGAFFDGGLNLVVPQLDVEVRLDNAAASSVLGMKWKPLKAANVATAYSLIARGLLPDKSAGKVLSTHSATASSSASGSTGGLSLEQWLSYDALIDPADLEGISWK